MCACALLSCVACIAQELEKLRTETIKLQEQLIQVGC